MVCVHRCNDVIVGNGGRFEKEAGCLNVKFEIRVYVFRTTIVTLNIKSSVVVNVL